MEIVMPKLGLTMTEATLSAWKKKSGDIVAEGEVVFEFESDKATMEYEAPAAGVLAEILVPAGQTVACGVPVAVLNTGASMAERSSVQTFEPPKVERIVATPAAKRRSRELGVSLQDLKGSGPEGRVQVADVEALAAGRQDIRPPAPVAQLAVDATPVAARLAADLGVALESIRGTGQGGRVTRDDVIAASRSAAAKPADAGLPTEVRQMKMPVGLVRRSEPLAGVRAVIAQRMSDSAFTAPHVTLHTEADATALVAARQQINEELGAVRGAGVKLSYNALLVAICARALSEHPNLNACLVDGSIHSYEPIHIALAVDTERGLVAPVIRDADRLDLTAIQTAGDTMIQRALTGTSLPDDLTGGTFTITNLGMFDIDGFTPIINQPQAAILGVGRIVSKAVDIGGEVGLQPRMVLSLSFDHRIVDGGPAARFLQRVKQLVERPFALVLPRA